MTRRLRYRSDFGQNGRMAEKRVFVCYRDQDVPFAVGRIADFLIGRFRTPGKVQPSSASRRATNCSLSSITEHSFHGITSSLKKGRKCNLCVRYDLSPMSRVAQKQLAKFSRWFQSAVSPHS